MGRYSDIIKAARRKMIASDYISPLIGKEIGADSMFPDTHHIAYTDGWIFRGETDTGRPLRDPTGLGTSAVTLNLRDPFSSPNMHNTLRFRQLQVFIFSDPSRAEIITAGGLPPQLKDAEDKCSIIADAIFQEFHDAANVDHQWDDDTYIVSCLCSSDLTIRDVTDKDGLVRGEMRFNLELL